MTNDSPHFTPEDLMVIDEAVGLLESQFPSLDREVIVLAAMNAFSEGHRHPDLLVLAAEQRVHAPPRN